MSARTALRTGTADAHARVDALFSTHDLASPAGYRDFLRRQAAAHLPVERALDQAGVADLLTDWPERRRADALRADLADLGSSPLDEQPFSLDDSPAALLGAVYVLEGSRLGGAVLRRQVPAGLPARFLSANSPGAWRTLIQIIDARLGDPHDLAVAIASASAVFRCFEAAAHRELERC